MMVTRTASGLRSLHRFVGADIVVYCEGGSSSTLSVSVADKYESHDIYYWTEAVKAMQLGKKCHFKSVGSKTTLKKLAIAVTVGGIETVTICYDSDYDVILGQPLPGGRTCHTLGYSWENDVLDDSVFRTIIKDLIGNGPQQEEALQKATLRICEFKNELAEWTQVDISLRRRGFRCVFDRENPSSNLDFNSHPSIRTNALKQLLIALGYKLKPRSVFAVTASNSLLVCFGKLVSKAMYHLAVDVLRKFGVARLDYDVFMRLAIANTFKQLENVYSGELARLHRDQVSCFV
jgi:hypothetical protein